MSTQHRKRFHVDPAGAQGYALKNKIKPFLTGLLEGAPLIEVALEGLKRGVNGEQRREYELRIATHGSTEQIHAALLTECSLETQELFAVAFQHRYNLTLAEYVEKVSNSESGMNGLVHAGAKYVNNTMEQIVRLLRSGKLTSEKAQQEFATRIFSDGTEEQAKELLASDKITSRFARQILTFKCGNNRGYEA